MKNIFKVALATLAIAGMSGAAHADLNYNGEVGLPLNPTAQIPQEGGFRLQGNYYDLGSSSRLYSVGGAIRASKTAPIEVNGAVNYVDGNAGNNDVRFSVGAKYLFSRETEPAGVRLAAGVGYSEYSLSTDHLKNARAYLVGSKSFGNPVEGKTSITGHLGLRYDHFEFGGGDSDKASVFAGVEIPVTPTGEIQLLGEVGSEVADGGNVPYSVGIRYRPMQKPFGATIGVQRVGIANDDPKLFVQIGYTFGK
ncbi:hypothetical protein IAD21_02731 [Abditibacteriota bacterium]|nr:hypothetical protein IAD21_02731 [Abditibacteriota bacterium]